MARRKLQSRATDQIEICSRLLLQSRDITACYSLQRAFDAMRKPAELVRYRQRYAVYELIQTRIDISKPMTPAVSANTAAVPGIPSLSWLRSKSFGTKITAG